MSSKVGEYIRAHVLGLLAILIALSGTAVAGQRTTSGDGTKASASVVTNAKFKKLKKRVAALESKAPPTIPTTLPPSGGAGGDLTGAYPNPQIGPGAVGSAEIGPGAIISRKFFFRNSLGFNFSSIAAETCIASTAIGVLGLESGDHVVMTPPPSFASTATLTGRPEPAGDVVRVQVCNHSTGAVDPDGTGGTYGILVIEDGP